MTQSIDTEPLDAEVAEVMARCRSWLDEVVSGGSPFNDAGSDPGEKVAALQTIVDGRAIYLSPIDMVAKRVVAGERIDVQELIVGVARPVGEMPDSGKYDRPA